MKDFKRAKTVQLLIMLVLTGCILLMLIKNRVLFHTIATTSQMGHILFLIWLLMVVCFGALIYDFTVYGQLKRKYGELDMAMYQDPMTGLGNRSSLDAFIDEYSGKDLPDGIGSITFILTHMGQINEEFGSTQGDRIIKDFSEILSEASRGVCFVGRNGGNQFLALFKETTETDIKNFIDTIRVLTEEKNKTYVGGGIAIKYGFSIHKSDVAQTMNELVASSYRKATDKQEDDFGLWKN